MIQGKIRPGPEKTGPDFRKLTYKTQTGFPQAVKPCDICTHKKAILRSE